MRTNWGAVCGLCGKAASGGRGQASRGGERAALGEGEGGSWRGRGVGFRMDSPCILFRWSCEKILFLRGEHLALGGSSRGGGGVGRVSEWILLL